MRISTVPWTMIINSFQGGFNKQQQHTILISVMWAPHTSDFSFHYGMKVPRRWWGATQWWSDQTDLLLVLFLGMKLPRNLEEQQLVSWTINMVLFLFGNIYQQTRQIISVQYTVAFSKWGHTYWYPLHRVHFNFQVT